MIIDEPQAASTRRPWAERRIAMVSIIGTWGVFLACTVMRLTMLRFPHLLLMTALNAVMACVGAGLCWPLYLVLRRLHRAPVTLRIATGTLLAVPLASVLTVLVFNERFRLAPAELYAARQVQATTLRGFFAREVTELFLLFTGWSALYSSVTSAISGREAEERAARAEMALRDAQLAALRHRLDPHLLFNVLNSISALLLRGDVDAADRAIVLLSSFLRAALTEPASSDATLADELERQRLYLSIEQLRFGERLRVLWSVPPELEPVRLPSLLLQPLVENVVRHALGATEAPVTMEVAVSSREGMLHLLVRDDGPGRSGAAGHGIGLRNVAARLLARYDGRATLRFGPDPEGGFQVELCLPLVDA